MELPGFPPMCAFPWGKKGYSEMPAFSLQERGASIPCSNGMTMWPFNHEEIRDPGTESNESAQADKACYHSPALGPKPRFSFLKIPRKMGTQFHFLSGKDFGINTEIRVCPHCYSGKPCQQFMRQDPEDKAASVLTLPLLVIAQPRALFPGAPWKRGKKTNRLWGQKHTLLWL